MVGRRSSPPQGRSVEGAQGADGKQLGRRDHHRRGQGRERHSREDGRGFATAAGYVAHVICEQFCSDRKPGETDIHRSRINGLLIDCNTDDIDSAARFWAEALGRAVDPDHPGTRGDYRMLESRRTSSACRSSASTMTAACISTSRPTTSRPRWRGSRSRREGRQKIGAVGRDAGPDRRAGARARAARWMAEEHQQLGLIAKPQRRAKPMEVSIM